jgi:hypothetical protein
VKKQHRGAAVELGRILQEEYIRALVRSENGIKHVTSSDSST